MMDIAISILFCLFIGISMLSLVIDIYKGFDGELFAKVFAIVCVLMAGSLFICAFIQMAISGC